MRENKNYRSYQFLLDPEQRIQKKLQKKFKNLKTGWARPRKREKKNYCSDQLLPDP